MSKDYKNGKVYKILNNITDDVYVGSTCQPLSKRMAWHRNGATNEKKQHYKLYQLMNELGSEHFYIELIHLFPCSCKDELHSEEGQWIRKIGTLNKFVAGRSKKEWNEDNDEHRKQYHKQYHQDHKEEHNARSKQYREEHPQEIKEYKKQHYEENKDEILATQKEKYEENKEVILERNKKWRDEHQEEQKEYHKNYRESNKEKVAETKKKCYENKKEEYLQKKRDYYQNKKEKHLCQCGSMVSEFEKSRHLKSQKHQAYLKQQEEN